METTSSIYQRIDSKHESIQEFFSLGIENHDNSKFILAQYFIELGILKTYWDEFKKNHTVSLVTTGQYDETLLFCIDTVSITLLEMNGLIQ